MAKDTQLPKDDEILIRLDAELAAQVRLKGQRFGSAQAVIRALLRRWVEGDITVTAEQVLAEVGRTGRVAQRPLGKRTPRADDK